MNWKILQDWTHARHLRTGIPEVIFAENKEDEDLLKIILHCANIGHVMVTRLTKDRYELIKPKIEVIKDNGLKFEYNRRARILVIKNREIEKKGQNWNFNCRNFRYSRCRRGTNYS